MAGYVDIGGHPTWVDDSGGAGAALLLMHGGMSNSDDLLRSIGGDLSKDYRVVAFDRRGHGRTADTEGAFDYEDMAAETVRVLETVVHGPAHLVGWSDGGIVALLVALSRPDLVDRLVVIGTNFHYNGTVPFDMDPQSPMAQELATAYVERSPDGAEHLEVVFRKSVALFTSEPQLTTADIGRIAHPALVVVGDDDVVTLAHTISLYEALPSGQLAVVPGASHALPFEQPDVLATLITTFLAGTQPPRTLMPVRRAAGA